MIPLVVAAGTGLGLVQALPAAAAEANPSIELFAADGVTPLGAAVVHPGDRIVVRGKGFDPAANTGGLPVPVPPGVPHGTFVTFGAFSPQWRPSEGAPTAARGLARADTAWVLSESALQRIPQAPLDLQRTVRKQWIPLAGDGTFTATLEVAKPAKMPADGVYGVYTYGAAEAVNASQELATTVRFDPAPGVNTPKPSAADLVWPVAAGFADTVTGPLSGTLSGSGGAAVRDKALNFEFDSAAVDPSTGKGTIKYRGTAVASTRFHLGEIAIANPWIEFTDSGTWLTAETSTSDTIGADSLRRVRLAQLDAAAQPGRTEWSQVPVTFEPTLSPMSLQPYAAQPGAPISFRY
ncbi:HtaA domain-containing protein [Nocardia sp. NBC_00511]|uniref:HtaA domain-containing protein n=1 Tax=Nocardia sp. NBC_00511 TaxID=2903591 RepID=UPI0030E35915